MSRVTPIAGRFHFCRKDSAAAAMGILVGLAPFVAFAVMTRVTGAGVSLWIAAAVSGFLILRDRSRGRSVKVLEGGTVILFLVLAAYTGIAHVSWDIAGARSVVDSGLLLIMLVSLAIRQPFTLQYAREQVQPSVSQSPAFVRTNVIITSVWALALAVVVLADLALHYVRHMPTWVATMLIVAALTGAYKFTAWYPNHLRGAS